MQKEKTLPKGVDSYTVADGSTRYRIRWSKNGIRQKPKGGFKTPEAAVAWCDEQRGADVLSRASTTNEVAAVVKREIWAHKTGATPKSYESSYLVRAEPLIGHKRISDVCEDIDLVREVIAQSKRDGYRKNSTFRMLTSLNSIAKYARRNKLAADNVVPLAMEELKEDNHGWPENIDGNLAHPLPAATCALVQLRLETNPNRYGGERGRLEDAVRWGLMWMGGLRTSEMGAVQWCDIITGEGVRAGRDFIRIQRHVSDKAVIAGTKTGIDTKRSVPIPPQLVALLAAYREVAQPRSENEYLFPSPTKPGQPSNYAAWTIQRWRDAGLWLRERLSDAALELDRFQYGGKGQKEGQECAGVRPYDGRACKATMLIYAMDATGDYAEEVEGDNRRISELNIERMMGHSIGTLRRHYMGQLHEMDFRAPVPYQVQLNAAWEQARALWASLPAEAEQMTSSKSKRATKRRLRAL